MKLEIARSGIEDDSPEEVAKEFPHLEIALN
jgi:hypothetical protein